MYIEFVLIYVGLGVLIAMLAAVLVLQITILAKIGKNKRSAGYVQFQSNPYGNANSANQRTGTVFCTQCATQFDAMHVVCPKCGKPR